VIQSKSLTLNSPGVRRSKILNFVLVTNAYIAKSSRVSTKPKNETPDEVTSPFADLVKAIDWEKWNTFLVSQFTTREDFLYTHIVLLLRLKHNEQHTLI
jgi:hypothetical protein